jgi:hypothetical protein
MARTKRRKHVCIRFGREIAEWKQQYAGNMIETPKTFQYAGSAEAGVQLHFGLFFVG